MVIINYNNDIGDYMEWSGQGWYAGQLLQRRVQAGDELHRVRADALSWYV